MTLPTRLQLVSFIHPGSEMHIEAPSRREVWLVVLLLASVLLISWSNPSSSVTSTGSALQEGVVVNSSLEVKPKNIRDVVQWGTGEVPHSSVVAHVPGELQKIHTSKI